jgi:hypothetical protein
VGYRLGTTPLLARLLQLAVAVTVLGLLFAWVHAARHPADRLAAAAPPFSAVRVSLRGRPAGVADALRARRRARVLRLANRHLPGAP